MSHQLNFFGPDGFYPGGVRRVGPEVDWKAIRDASYERERAWQHAKQSASNGAVPDTAEVNPTSANAKPASYQEKDTKGSNRYDKSTRDNSVSSGRSSESTPNTPVPTVSEKLTKLLSAPVLDLDAVRKLAWGGLPTSFRAPVWKILLGYVPTNSSRRKDTLQRRRREYWEAVHQHYGSSGEGETFQDTLRPWRGSNTYTRLGQQEDVTMRQITVDLPRTCPGQALFHIPEVRLSLERILYVWATRHPASGYVQGMNDLVTPFVFVFLSERAKAGTGNEILGMKDLSAISDSEESLANAEADAYWCLTALLNDIQDYYTFSQPGIQRRVHYLRELVARVDSHLCSHLEDEGLDFLQFAFRWMNCLLMRELPFPLIARVWDTYLAESDGFAVFHVYVCAALLVSFSEELQEMDFQDMVMFLQNLPTESWTSKEVDVILSQAYMWRTIFGAAPSHLQ
eukprot:GFKZ01002601.1.p1 GENE.GFKZ01002601.1~~GFKZ01002601.1.p1  ORF type:complete len:455 (+),score=41.21 GFKZ01002601.1:3499-4863(+)